MRELVLAAAAVLALAALSTVNAQPRQDVKERPRPVPEDVRPSGFQGMLRDIAGARLDRAHAQRGKAADPNDKNQKRR